MHRLAFTILITIMILPLSSAYNVSGKYTNLDGSTSDISEFEGKSVLIEAFSTTCSHCMDMHEHLEKVHEEFNNDIDILSLSINDKDSAEVIREYNNTYPITWKVGMDTEDLTKQFDVKYTPTMILLDTTGNFVNCWVGTTEFSILQKEFNNYLSDPSAYMSDHQNNGVCINPKDNSVINTIIYAVILYAGFLLITKVLKKND